MTCLLAETVFTVAWGAGVDACSQSDPEYTAAPSAAAFSSARCHFSLASALPSISMMSSSPPTLAMAGRGAASMPPRRMPVDSMKRRRVMPLGLCSSWVSPFAAVCDDWAPAGLAANIGGERMAVCSKTEFATDGYACCTEHFGECSVDGRSFYTDTRRVT